MITNLRQQLFQVLTIPLQVQVIASLPVVLRLTELVFSKLIFLEPISVYQSQFNIVFITILPVLASFLTQPWMKDVSVGQQSAVVIVGSVHQLPFILNQYKIEDGWHILLGIWFKYYRHKWLNCRVWRKCMYIA